MVVQDKLYTVEEFWGYCQQAANADKRLELVKGVIDEVAPSSPLNTIVAGRLVHFLNAHVLARDLGYVTGADGEFVLGAQDVRLPDAAFIARSRVPHLPDKVFPVAPDLAVEVVSASETPRSVTDKVRAYLEAGTQLVWAVYPEDRIIDVYRLNPDGSMNLQTLDAEGTLSGGDVLPEFTLPVHEVFPVEEQA